jgi:hypothetical protein
VGRDLFCFAAPLRLPLGPQRGAVDFLSPEVDLADPSRAGTVLSGIRVEDDEIDVLARRHPANIRRKLNPHSESELVLYAVRNGIIQA